MQKKNIIFVALFLGLGAVMFTLPFAYSRFFRNPDTLKIEHFQQGKTYFDQKRFAAAIVEWKNAIQLDPQFAQAHYYLGQAYIEGDQFARALEPLERSVGLNPGLVEAQLALAELYLTINVQESLWRAQQLGQQLSQVDSTSVEGYLILSQVAVAEGRQEDALAAVHAAQQRMTPPAPSAERHPNDLKVQLQLADVHWKRGDLVKAETLFKETLAAYEKAIDPYVYLGYFYQFTQRLPAAETIFRKAMAVDRSNPQGAFLLGKLFDTRAMGDTAAVYRAMTDSAWHYIGRASELSPEKLTYKKNLAYLALRKNQREAATNLIEEIRQYDPNDLGVLYLQGRLQLQKGENQAALSSLQQVAEHYPNYAFDWYTERDLGYFLAQAYQRNGQHREARQALSQVSSAVAQKPHYHLLEAELDLALGEQASAMRQIKQLRNAYPEIDQLAWLETQALLQGPDQGQRTEGLKQMIARLEKELAENPENLQAALALGNYLLQDGQTDRAEATLTRAVAQNPNSATARSMLGNMYAATKRLDQAEEAYLLAVQNEPEHFGAHHLLGQLYALKGEFGKAVAPLERALEIEKDFQLARKALAYAYLQQGQLEGGEKIIQQLAANQADDLDNLYLQGRLYLAQGKPREALDVFLQVQSMAPQYRLSPFPADLKELMVMAYYSSGQYATGLGIAEAVLQEDPDHLVARLLRAEARLLQQQLPAALDDFKAVTKGDPENVFAHYGVGIVYANQGRYQEALKAFEQVLAIEPHINRALEAMVNVHLGLGLFEAAHAVCQDQLTRFPDKPIVPFLLGRISLAQGRLEEGENHLKKALSLDAKQPLWHFTLGGLYLQKGDYQNAKHSFEQALALAPHYAAAANDLAWILAETNEDLPRARRLANRALQQSPGDWKILDTLGWIHFKSRDFGEAVRLLQLAVDHNPQHPTLYYHLGRAFLEHNQEEAGQQALEKSLVLDAAHADADTVHYILAELR